MIIKNGTVFTEDCEFQQLDIEIKDHTIIDLKKEPQATTLPENVNLSDFSSTTQEEIDASDCYVIPGLTDIHFHGCVGYDFCDGTLEAIEQIVAYELSSGITTVCPATMTLPVETLSTICQSASQYISSGPLSPLVGINLEGPFISEIKKGAQNKKYIIKPNYNLLQQLQKDSSNLIKLVAIAPEEEGAIDLISSLKNEFVFSIAHTNANYQIAMDAFHAGASHVTHMYNAMLPFTHREPGVIGAAFDTPHCKVELICDGIHIEPVVIRSTFQLFGDDRIVLVSDSMMATGMEDGEYSLGGQGVTVKGRLATLTDGTIAGSVTNLFHCMCTAIKMGIAPVSAIKAATMNPAKAIGVFDKYGSISKGKIANILILNKDFSLKTVIFQGTILK